MTHTKVIVRLTEVAVRQTDGNPQCPVPHPISKSTTASLRRETSPPRYTHKRHEDKRFANPLWCDPGNNGIRPRKISKILKQCFLRRLNWQWYAFEDETGATLSNVCAIDLCRERAHRPTYPSTILHPQWSQERRGFTLKMSLNGLE
jgi:hypothetical protein